MPRASVTAVPVSNLVPLDPSSPRTVRGGVTRRRKIAVVATVLITGLLLVGCTQNGFETSPVSRSTPDAGPGAAQGSFATVDSALIGGLQAGELANDDAGVTKVAVLYGDRGVRNLVLALELATNKGLRNNASANGTDYVQEWRALGSSPNAVGVLLTTTSTVDGRRREVPMGVWYDPATKRGVATPGLIGKDNWGAFSQAVLAALPDGADADKVESALQSQAQPYGDGPAMGFDAEGNAILAFRGDLVPGVVRVPRAEIDPLLSPFGTRAQGAATKPSAYDPSAKVEQVDRKESIGGEDEKASASPTPEPSTIEIPDGPGGSGESEDESDTEPPTAAYAPRPYPWVGVNCAAAKCVAVSYDDGPASGTADVVNNYVSAGQAATFFVLGQVLKDNPERTQFAAARGMEIASHTYTHTSLRSFAGSDQKMKKEIGNTADLIEKTVGRPPLFLRPPYGAQNEEIRDQVKKYNQAVINWNVDSLDWQTQDATQTLSSVKSAEAGSVILMHDIHQSTVDASGPITTELTDAGVILVTVGEISDYEWGAGKLVCAVGSFDACKF